MNAGKIASISMWLMLTALAVLAVGATFRLEHLATLDLAQRLIAVGIMFGATAALVILPVGMATDRAMKKLQRYIEGAADESDMSLRVPGWLRPLVRAMAGAVDQFRERETALKNKLRDVEVRLRVAESERRQILEVLHSLRDGVLVTDAFNEVVTANQAAADIFEFDLEEATHQPIESVVGDQRVCQLICDTRDDANFKNRRHVEHEIACNKRAGVSNPVYDVCLTCVENHNQEAGGVVAIFHDLSREREVSQMKSDFVSKASHELRTPLSSIRAYVEMLVDGEALDDESRNEFYRIIQSETDRLSRLIDNMLNISRIEAGIVQIDRENVDIKPLVKRGLASLEPQAGEKNIGLASKLAPLDLCVEGDPDMLYQVVVNLVSNAIKYTPEGGRVTVSADSDNLTRSVVVTVADTGLGISPDAIPRLFEKFYRVENYKRVAKGTGLGLSLCKHIVETVHHGQIGVDSKLGMGSRFWFSIPMEYAGSKAAA